MGKLSSGQYSAPVDEVLTLIVANTLSVNKANYSSTASGPPSLAREGLRKRCQAHSATPKGRAFNKPSSERKVAFSKENDGRSLRKHSLSQCIGFEEKTARTLLQSRFARQLPPGGSLYTRLAALEMNCASA